MRSELDILWEKILSGREDAFESLYKKTYPVLYRHALFYSGSPQTAEEIVQDVMVKIWENRTVILISGSIISYLLRSVHNHALNTLRGLKSLKQSVNKTASEEFWQVYAENYSPDGYFIDLLFADELNAMVEKTINLLPEKCRQIFRLSRHEQLSIEEISQKLGISESTVRTQISIALQKITNSLKNQNNKYEY